MEGEKWNIFVQKGNGAPVTIVATPKEFKVSVRDLEGRIQYDIWKLN